MEALADAVGLRPFGFGVRIDVLDREVDFVRVPDTIFMSKKAAL